MVNRLKNRLTFIEWEKEVLGPIRDTQGVEQGACSSDTLYKLVNNEQLQIAQESQLGMDLGTLVDENGQLNRQILSAAGLADDVCLLSTSAEKVKLLLHLTKLFCDKYQVKLVSSKTKLLIFTNKQTELTARVELASTSISMNGEEIFPSTQATHVGVVRSVDGNAANIMARLSAHRKAVFAVLHAGLSLGHRRANPAASLRVEAIYGVSVLLSGLASVVLTNKEVSTLDQYYKVHLQRLLRLHQATPAPVIFLLAGCLPFQAQLHLKMFSIFGEVCRLNNGQNILAKHAAAIYSSASSSSKPWFWKLRDLCILSEGSSPFQRSCIHSTLTHQCTGSSRDTSVGSQYLEGWDMTYNTFKTSLVSSVSIEQ